MTFNNAKEKTVAKYEEIYKLLGELEAKHEDSCAFCQKYKLESKCPAYELCGCCEPMNNDALYREIGRKIQHLNVIILELIQKINGLEETI